jgi:hypothetical protein
LLGKDLRIFRKTIELKVEKRIVGTSIRMQKMIGHCGRVGPLQNE